jgi:hypothetical protein
MGGRALLGLLPNANFPRMAPSLYQHLKRTLQPRVEAMYELVVVPEEAPEKADHGDLDFLVCSPREGLTHEEVKMAIGAIASISMEGPRTSHFAVPIHVHAGEYFTQANQDAMVQVDIHVCEDRAELERIRFYHSYGDLGMIVGVIARGVGFHLGTAGLKVRDFSLII